MKKLTLEEIGKRAGVSRSTVSRVLNGQPDVRPAVRQRVEEVIAETGYAPNQAARALVSSRSGLIGLVMLTEVDELFGDPYYSALVDGIQHGCAEHDVIFSIFPVRGTDEHPDVLSAQIAQGFVDGIIVTAGPGRDRFIATMRDRRQRMVVVGHPADGEGLQRVDVDNRGGTAAAVRHLIEHGRRRIAYVGPTSEFLYGEERFDGYLDALREADLPVDDDLVVRAAPSAEGGHRATLAVLDARPDAIHAATDPMARGTFWALTERGLSIPDDVAVVGFDGLPRGPVTVPELTTVVQPVIDVGRAAVERLIGDADDTTPVILPTTLRIGASCGHALTHTAR